MGARAYVRRRLLERLGKKLDIEYVGRPYRASPSEGYAGQHVVEQDRIIAEALSRMKHAKRRYCITLTRTARRCDAARVSARHRATIPSTRTSACRFRIRTGRSRTSDSAPTRAWMAAEETLTAQYFAGIPERARIKAHLERIVDYARYVATVPRRKPLTSTRITRACRIRACSTRWMVARETARVARSQRPLDDGTIALGGTAPTYDGRYLAYATQQSGSDWQTWHVRVVASGSRPSRHAALEQVLRCDVAARR